MERYNTVITALLDRMAPLTDLTVRDRHHQPWFDAESRATRRRVRRLERRCKTTQSPEAFAVWRTALRASRKRSHAKAAIYWRGKISSAKKDARSAWRTVNELLGERKSECDHTFSAAEFHDFIDGKVADIRAATSSAAAPSFSVNATSTFSQFCTIDVDLVTAIIAESPTKTCALDPLPTWLLKECVSTLAPYVTKVINWTLTSGCFPTPWKHAIISLLIKKPGLDEGVLLNYRPVSNLPFLSKVLE